MAIVYQSIHTFENMVRQFVQKAFSEEFEASGGRTYLKRSVTRLRLDGRRRPVQMAWATQSSEIMYCDFGDLSSMITTNWTVFEDVIVNLESGQSIAEHLKNLEISSCTATLELEDIERIGMNIRDWVRQVG